MKQNILRGILVLALFFVFCGSVFAAENNRAALDSVRSSFRNAYDAEWSMSDLSLKLFNIVDKKFAENIASLQYGTVTIQLALNRNNIVEKIQEDIFNAFRPEYEKFLGRFQETFYSRTASEIPRHLSGRKAIQVVNAIGATLNNAPKFYVGERTEREFLSNIWEKISSEISSPFSPVIYLILGFSIFLLRGSISYILRRFGKDAQFVRIIIGIAGFSVMLYGVYKGFNLVGTNSLASRVVMYTSTRDFYMTDLARAYWLDIEHQIVKALL